MKLVKNEKEIDNAFSLAKQEAKKYFSDDSVYIEKYFEKPRHIEVQILSDQKNAFQPLGGYRAEPGKIRMENPLQATRNVHTETKFCQIFGQVFDQDLHDLQDLQATTRYQTEINTFN